MKVGMDLVWSCTARRQAVDGEDNRGVEKPCRVSAKNARDEVKPCIQTQRKKNKKKGRLEGAESGESWVN